MGYSTDFEGRFTITPPLTPERRAYLQQFADTRRMKRDAARTALRPDPIREAVGLPVGDEGGYFVGEDGYAGQNRASDIVNYNTEPAGQPGLWCKWVPSEDGTRLEWSGAEKFYDYVEWLEYLIVHFLKPWGHVVQGTVTWQGEESGDRGRIVVTQNAVRTQRVRVVYR